MPDARLPSPADPAGHDLLAELVALGPLAVLDPHEQRHVAEHLATGCARCRAEHDAAWEALGVLSLTGPSVAPSPEARRALAAAVALPREGERAGGEREGAAPVVPLAQRARRRSWATFAQPLAAGLALVLATGALVASLRTGTEARREVARARGEADERLAEQAQRLDEIAARVSGLDGALATLSTHAGVRSLALAGGDAFEGSRAQVVIDENGQQVLLLASRLPPAPAGHTYQLWVIVSGVPKSLGVFDSDAEGRVLHVETGTPDLKHEVKLAVSVEPAGGVPAPTGPIVLFSH